MAANDENQRPLIGLLFVGSTLVGSIVLGYFLGTLIDRSLDTAPWGILIGVLLGAVAGFAGLIRIIQRTLK
jgi:F0F1-type ATP synthase assembly protein I